jgi:hypothetical protein
MYVNTDRDFIYKETASTLFVLILALPWEFYMSVEVPLRQQQTLQSQFLML